jgi:Bacteriophage tail sheath protein
MPSALTYPGVYVEEIPSGVITTSWDDFVREFGGLDLNFPLGFAVRDFYLNGGTQAVIARVYKAPGGTAKPLAELDAKGLALEAASPGAWANTLRVRVTKTDVAKLTEVAKMLGVLPADLFNLAIQDTRTGTTERFINLTATKSSSRHVTGILLNESAFVRTKNGTTPADPTGVHGDPAAGKSVWEDDNASTKATEAADSAALAAAADFGDDAAGTGLYLLAQADLFNLLCIPPDTLTGSVPAALHPAAAKFCVQRRAFYIVDSPADWTTIASVQPDTLNIAGLDARNAALYFPRQIQANPLHGDQPEPFVSCGTIAGVMARTDVTRGVWKAPAGVDASLTGVIGLSVLMNDDQNGLLNPIGVNCLRAFPIIGKVIWGARTMRGADVLGDEYKYVPVRRLALFIEESLFRGLKWVVFEPNDEPLWAQIRLNVGAFMQGLFRQGAFQGTSARDAYFVKCDKDTTTQNHINLGIVNIVVGFAPLKPAEFVVLQIQQMAGQIQT